MKTWEEAVNNELESATAKFGAFHNHHEGYAVMLEEMDEFWDSIKSNSPDLEELIQLAAMCKRMYVDCFKGSRL